MHVLTRVVACASVLAAAAAPAAAAAVPFPGQVLLRLDSATPSQLSGSTLFGASTVLVPGDTATARFAVQNTTPHRAVLSLALDNARSNDQLLLTVLVVRASTPHSASRRTPLSSAARCPTLLRTTPLAPGARTVVTLAVGMSSGIVGTHHQAKLASFRFVAGLRAPVDPVGGGGLCSGVDGASTHHPHAGGSGPLAATGTDIVLGLLAGAVLCGIGTTLVVTARRPRTPDSEERP